MCKAYFIVATLLFVFVSNNLSGQCLRLIHPHQPQNGKYNPDSVMIDTCSTLYPKPMYAKGKFEILFKYAAFGFIDSAGYFDQIIKNSEDIDTNYTLLLNRFDSIANVYGQFHFIKKFAHIPDTITRASRAFYIVFDSYVNINNVLHLLNDTTLFENAYYANNAIILPGNFTSVSYTDFVQSVVTLYPNPAKEYITITSNAELTGTIELFDVLGTILVVKSSEYGSASATLDIHTLPNGVYGVRIPTARGIYTANVVVAR